MWMWLFLWAGGSEACPRNFFLNTLNNAFWRHIYTELGNQAIPQVIVQIMFTGNQKKLERSSFL